MHVQMKLFVIFMRFQIDGQQKEVETLCDSKIEMEVILYEQCSTEFSAPL